MRFARPQSSSPSGDIMPAAHRSFSRISAGALLNSVFLVLAHSRSFSPSSAGPLPHSVSLVLAVALTAALLIQMAGAWSELRSADRTSKLAATDRILFETTGAIRLTRGDSQTVLQTVDDAKTKLDETRAQTDARLKSVLDGIDPALAAGIAEQRAEILKRWAAVAPFHANMLALAAKPRA